MVKTPFVNIINILLITIKIPQNEYTRIKKEQFGAASNAS